MKTLSTILLILLSISYLGQSPLVYNQGMIYNDALIHVNGDWENQHNSTLLTNHGEIWLRADNNNGDFYISDSALVSGGGVYRLENDWSNSGVFIADRSHVYLDGSNQLITGDSVTQYFDLTLEGSGVKSQTIHSEVEHQLNLNNLELATQNFEMYVSNSWDSAIIHQSTYLSEGFVSSLTGGLLIRKTDSTKTYLFPVGSSANGHQFRPVTIENQSLNSERVGVRMIPEDATLNGLDREEKDSLICFINDDYYHEIKAVENLDQSNITVYYDPNLEPNWNILAQWNTPSSNRWNMLNTNGSSLYSYSGRTVSNHNNFSNDYYALGYYNEFSPNIYGDTIICDTTALYTYSTDSYSSYSWVATNTNGTITNSNQEQIELFWPNDPNTELSLTTTDSYGCVSPAATISIAIDHISASYDTIAVGGAGTIIFENTSLGADDIEWTIGDYISYNDQEEFTFTDIGTYDVQLIATNNLGCSDTTTGVLEIPALFWVPNVITPNGNGENDLFYIDALGVDEYRLIIYDRWGLKMFESTNAAWDGKNQTNNQPVPEGTYYFIYTAIDYSGVRHEYTGPISLFR
ncbi:gliding motility-associated C-terminal domain-containing protein [Parvicella tangerina]|uniref:gliding motility-associated C-terminal domain-containing protein n=1 Tax=Parvicella tangerina TaxID=2829795 RepID=UPI00215C72E6|nr:gliding motility-associated C-terminal domain-containing protein [Parvicella tangerina]